MKNTVSSIIAMMAVIGGLSFFYGLYIMSENYELAGKLTVIGLLVWVTCLIIYWNMEL
jgi:hypothetical protein